MYFLGTEPGPFQMLKFYFIIYLPVTPTLRSRRLMVWGQPNITKKKSAAILVLQVGVSPIFKKLRGNVCFWFAAMGISVHQ